MNYAPRTFLGYKLPESEQWDAVLRDVTPELRDQAAAEIRKMDMLANLQAQHPHAKIEEAWLDGEKIFPLAPSA